MQLSEVGRARPEENSRRFARLSEQLLDFIWSSYPVDATICGIHDYDHTFGDLSAGAFRSQSAKFKEFLSALETDVDPSLLDPEDELDYHAAVSMASSNFIALEHQRYWMVNPATYPSLVLRGCFLLMARGFAPVEDRTRLMIGRVREIPDALRVSRENIADAPRLLTQVAIEITHGGLAFFKNAIPHLASQVPSLQGELATANDACISALEEHERWLSETLLPVSQSDFAVGADVYQHLLLGEHRLTYTPQELVLMAEQMLREALDALEDAAAEIEPQASWQDILSRVKHEHPPNDKLLQAYRSAIQRAKEFVIEHDLVTIPKGESLNVAPTPEFERCILPYAAYMPPAPFETNQSGCFWVTPLDEDATPEQQEAQLQGHCVYSIPVIALHEAYPGHHLQLTRGNRIRSRLRKQMFSTLFMEGWAMYCEELMNDLGFYTDPRVRLFYLKNLVWRTCRVIIDVGLHTGEMSFDQAVRMLVDTARLEKVHALAEAKRYAMYPTQPMSYAIGKLLILELRDKMKQAFGSSFDLKEFHDRLLDYGPIPTPLIAETMTREPPAKPAVQLLRRSA